MGIAAFFRSFMIAATLTALAGCASVPMAPKEKDAASKTFQAPSRMAGIYIYRDTIMGQGVKKLVSIDGAVIGATVNKVYFHREITPGEHTLATESEFGDNELQINVQAGKNYYFEQTMKPGLLRGGSNLLAVAEEEGKQAVLKCNEAR